jgi:predicted kinase
MVKDLVLVSGAPGSGKTTLAVPLAAALHLPLLSKDVIKEQLYDTLGDRDGDDPWSWSRRLGAASMELMWTLAGYFPQVVLEANFRPHSTYERERIAHLGERVVEVNCVCPIEIAAARYAARARTDQHHPVHLQHELTDELAAEFDEPVGIGTVIPVNTIDAVDVTSLARRIATLLA